MVIETQAQGWRKIHRKKKHIQQREACNHGLNGGVMGSWRQWNRHKIGKYVWWKRHKSMVTEEDIWDYVYGGRDTDI